MAVATAAGISMQILKPSRITSLGNVSIRIIEHTGIVETKTHTVHAYPFERILSIKQRISELFEAKDAIHIPDALFLARRISADGDAPKYVPIEFSWNIDQAGAIHDPFTHLGEPDTRLFDDAGNRRVDIAATEHAGLLLEDAIELNEKTETELHMWTLHAIVSAMGLSSDSDIPNMIMEGYFQLYYPRISKLAVLQNYDRPLSTGEREDYDASVFYHTEMDKRLERLDSRLSELEAAPCTLYQLYRVRYMLPPPAEYKSSADLELKFYESKPSDTIPFIRYFPGNQRIPPMVKLAETAAKQPVVEQSLLAKMLRDIPDSSDDTKHGVLLYKIPVINTDGVDIPAETLWTLTVFGRDGSAELALHAPRKERPLSYSAVQYAFTKMSEIMKTVGYSDTDLKLIDMNGMYRISVDTVEKKPTVHDLKKRIDLFQTFISPSRMLETQKIAGLAFTLRYKAVSNFIKEQNPIFEHLTLLTFDQGKSELLKAEEYIADLKSQFGLSQAFAASYVAQWSALHEEIRQEGKSIIDTANPGGLVGLRNNHPVYDLVILNMQSQHDLERLLSLMSVFVSFSTKELMISDDVEDMAEFASADGKVDADAAANEIAHQSQAAEGATNAVVPSAEEANYEADLLSQLGTFGDFVNLGGVEEAVKEVEAEAEAAPPPPAEPVVKPLGPSSKVKYTKDEATYLKQLQQYNKTMFDPILPPEKKKLGYSKICQSAQGRQPNVLSFSQYKRARQIYKDDVTWVEGPLEKSDAEAVAIASKALNSRGTFLNKGKPKRSDRTIYDFEVQALELGFPLKDNESISEKSGFTTEERNRVQELMKKQGEKPLWVVFRLGTKSDVGQLTNYYLCAEYWCLHDNLPLLPSIVKKTERCPFCGGRIILDTKSPQMGETVLKRKDHDGMHNYIGFFNESRHPDDYAQPCCFKSPDAVLPPPDAIQEFPPLQLDLPDQQAAKMAKRTTVNERDEDKKEGKEEEIKSDLYRNKPFTSKRDKVKKNEWFIPNQKVVGRTIEGWVDITPKFKGIVSVPPQTVNTLLNQNPETFLTAIRGVQAKSQNSYLEVPGRAFVRYGLGTDPSKPGDNLFSLIAFAEYASHFLHDENANASIKSNDEIRDFWFSDAQPNLVRSLSIFEQANYGTLLHEFSVPQVELEDDQREAFQAWWKKTGGHYNGPSDRAYAIQTYLAYSNFENYVKDTSVKKELRYFTSFFATPRYLSGSGFIPIVINYYRKNTPAQIMCPEFGISFYHQEPKHRPPILFIVHDVESGIYDPLVLYEGVKNADGSEEQRIVGLIHPDTPSFARLSPELRTSIQGFIDKYFSPVGGCGRQAIPVHPWMSTRDTATVPRLSDLIHVLDLVDPKKPGREKYVLTANIRKDALFRDRSNRLIGVIVRFLYNKSDTGKSETRYIVIPCVDDGYISNDFLKNVRGELNDPNMALKLPSMDEVFFVLTGRLTKIDETRLVGHFKAYEPVKLVRFNGGKGEGRDDKYVALELRCGIWIPTQPMKLTDSIPLTRFKELQRKQVISDIVDEMPWDINDAVVGPKDPDAESISYTSEEELDESYQLFRLAFSEWLRTSRHGDFVRGQIELLRQARKRLPLFELQKRLDILLSAIVNPSNPSETWFTTEGSTTKPVFRRNCLKLSKDQCTSGCVWIRHEDPASEEGRCLIHTAATERYLDPVRTLIARLVDELLRTFTLADEILEGRVSRLQPMEEGKITHEDGSLVFSLPGRGDEELYHQLGYSGRKPTEYTKGLVFPEETSLPGLFDEGDIPGDFSAEWAAVFRHLLLGTDVSRSPAIKFQIIVTALTGIPFAQYEKTVGRPITGTLDDWAELAEAKGFEVIMTHVDPVSQLLQPYKWIQGYKGTSESHTFMFVVLDADQLPLQHIETSAVKMKLESLPGSLRKWIRAQMGLEEAPVPPKPTEGVEAPPVPKPSTFKKPGAPPTPLVASRKPRGKLVYKLGKTLTDGDCFFSSIFRSLREISKPKLSAVAKCLGITAVSEPKFIESFRTKLANHIAAGNLPREGAGVGGIDTYDYLKGLVNDSPANFEARSKDYPDWFVSTFGSYGEHIGTRAEFLTRLAEQVRTRGKWVGEIEYFLVKPMLAACKVELRVHKSNKISSVGVLQFEDGDKIIVNLYNKSEQHYEYFKKEDGDKEDE